MKEVASVPRCFVCGQKNQVGLKAHFFWDGERAFCDITADEMYAGYKRILHGGIVATLLDEVMIKSLLAEEIFAVTAEITVRFRKPVHTGDRLHFEGWRTGEQQTDYFTNGRAINQSGETVAEAAARYVKPRSGLSDRLRESVEDDDT
ncbi:MAG: PaaI family thioesterase [Candidatus Zixiibacteriota bacterium]